MRHLTVRLKSKTLSLYPICDVQVGARGVDETGFREHVKDALKNPDARFIGVGDYTDGVSPSNRRLLAAAFVKNELYDTVRDMFDGAAHEQTAQFLRLVSGTEGRWDAMLSGHHFWTYVLRNPDGSATLRSSDMEIAQALGAPFVEDDSDVMVSYVFPASKGKQAPVLKVFARHGQGEGQTFASPINQLERQMRAFTAHVYVVGHHHRLVAAGGVKLDEAPNTETQLMATDSRLVSAGSWMRGYMPDYVTYAEAGMMVPLATGAPVITAECRANGSFKVRVLV